MDENECLDVNELIEMNYVGVLILLIKLCRMLHSNFKTIQNQTNLFYILFTWKNDLHFFVTNFIFPFDSAQGQVLMLIVC